MKYLFVIFILIVVIFSIILFKPQYTKPIHNIQPKPIIKPIIKEPKPENSVRFKFSNDVVIEKSQKPSPELLNMYKEPKNEIPSDNPFVCQSKPQKKQLPYMNENIELLK